MQGKWSDRVAPEELVHPDQPQIYLNSGRRAREAGVARHANPESETKGSRQSIEENWLAQLDAKAGKLPRAKDWLGEYIYFMFARYPHLRPKPVSRNNRSRSHWRGGFQSFCQTLALWERKIAADKKAKRALQGLDADQRSQLAALVAETVTVFGQYRQARIWHWQQKKLLSEGPRRLRMLMRKLRNASEAITELLHYAQSLDPPIGEVFQNADKPCLERLGDLRTGRTRVMIPFLALPSQPTNSGMIQLYWFFRNGCQLSGDESEVRVAMIRNAFWTEYGVSKVEYRPHYLYAEKSKGCDAVRLAVRRFRLDRGTTR